MRFVLKEETGAGKVKSRHQDLLFDARLSISQKTEFQSGGSDGTRTRGLRRDRPAL
jgi:hypothetical protein